MSQTVFIGVGNEFRQDDSLGLWMVRQLRSYGASAGYGFFESSGEGLGLIDLWRDYQTVVIFDAVMKQGQPGRRIHLSAAGDQMPSDFFKYSSHAFSLAEAVEMSRILGLLPAQLHIYGVEGAQFGYGQDLSSVIAASCNALLHEIKTEYFAAHLPVSGR